MNTDLFKAEPLPAQEVLQYELGSVGYRVPQYQRDYRWSKGNISRLVEDVSHGLLNHSLGSTQPTVSFLGTLLLVSESHSQEQSYRGQSLSIVDGQQRLTTLVLLLCRIDAFVHQTLQTLDTNQRPHYWLSIELEYLRKRIHPCIATGNFNVVPSSPYDFVPKIVRALTDERAHSSNAIYESPVAEYLFSYTRFRYNLMTGAEDDPPLPRSEHATLTERINELDRHLKTLFQGPSEEDAPITSISDLFDKSNFRHLFRDLAGPYSDLVRTLKGDIDSQLSADAQMSALICAFAHYLLAHVRFIFVTVTDEQYAFQVFEALNTTGESLTALETFKPVVIRKEDDGDTPQGYNHSPSRRNIEEIENYLLSFDKSEDQSKISESVVIATALYVSGEKIGSHLAEQRRYLQDTYSKRTTPSQRQEFVRAPYDIVDYRDRFWDDPANVMFVNLGKHTQVVYACFSFLKSTNTSLTIPVITRFWRAYQDGHIDADDFAGFVRAVAGFVALRRGATSGTKNIDGDLRELMQKGDSNSRTFGPLRIGAADTTAVPPLQDFQALLRHFLSRKPVRVGGREDWIDKASKLPLANINSGLCKFLLLSASTSAASDQEDPLLLTPVNPSAANDFLTVDIWTAPDAESVEHIAPRQPRPGFWPDDVYTEPDLVDTLGNLVPFPKGANASLGDGSPEKKWYVYRALAADTLEERETYIKEAKDAGARMKTSMEDSVRNSRQLPLVKSLAAYEGEWDADTVKRRSVNIAERAWDTISGWIGF